MDNSNDKPVGPPGGGSQDHDAMQAASMRSVVSGQAGTDTLAAIGGLNVPGHESHPELASNAATHRPEPIPGERDSTNLTRREPGTFSPAPRPGPDTEAKPGEGS